MSQITPNYDNNYILSQTQVPQSLLVNQHPAQTQEVTLPDLYYMPDNFEKKKGFKDVIKKFDLFRIVTPWFEHPLMTLGAYVGIGLGVDAFDKSCNKEYEKSIVSEDQDRNSSTDMNTIFQTLSILCFQQRQFITARQKLKGQEPFLRDESSY